MNLDLIQSNLLQKTILLCYNDQYFFDIYEKINFVLMFCSAEEILVRMKGEQVTPRYLERHGFNYPIVITEMEGLGLKLPPPTFSVKDVEQYVGKEFLRVYGNTLV